MDFSQKFENITSLADYSKFTAEIITAPPNLCDSYFSEIRSLIAYLNDFRDYELEYFQENSQFGAVAVLCEALTQEQGGESWSHKGKPLVFLYRYWYMSSKVLWKETDKWWNFIEKILELISKLSEKHQSIKDLIVQEMTEPILDMLCSKDSYAISDGRELPLLKSLNSWTRNSSRQLRTNLYGSLRQYLDQLGSKISECSDIEIQFALLEAMLRWMTKRKERSVRAQAAATLFPFTNWDLPRMIFERHDFSHFENDARLFLNGVNKIENRIVSFLAKKCCFGDKQIILDEQSMEIWVDINTKRRNIKVFCDFDQTFITQSAVSSQTDVLTINYEITDNIRMYRHTDEIITIELKTMHRPSFNRSVEMKQECCLIYFKLSSNNDFSRVDYALKQAFGDKYTNEILSESLKNLLTSESPSAVPVTSRRKIFSSSDEDKNINFEIPNTVTLRNRSKKLADVSSCFATSEACSSPKSSSSSVARLPEKLRNMKSNEHFTKEFRNVFDEVSCLSKIKEESITRVGYNATKCYNTVTENPVQPRNILSQIEEEEESNLSRLRRQFENTLNEKDNLNSKKVAVSNQEENFVDEIIQEVLQVNNNKTVHEAYDNLEEVTESIDLNTTKSTKRDDIVEDTSAKRDPFQKFPNSKHISVVKEKRLVVQVKAWKSPKQDDFIEKSCVDTIRVNQVLNSGEEKVYQSKSIEKDKDLSSAKNNLNVDQSNKDNLGKTLKFGKGITTRKKSLNIDENKENTIKNNLNLNQESRFFKTYKEDLKICQNRESNYSSSTDNDSSFGKIRRDVKTIKNNSKTSKELSRSILSKKSLKSGPTSEKNIRNTNLKRGIRSSTPIKSNTVLESSQEKTLFKNKDSTTDIGSVISNTPDIGHKDTLSDCNSDADVPLIVLKNKKRTVKKIKHIKTIDEDVERSINDFFKQNATGNDEIPISPTLARRINDSSSGSEDFDNQPKFTESFISGKCTDVKIIDEPFVNVQVCETVLESHNKTNLILVPQLRDLCYDAEEVLGCLNNLIETVCLRFDSEKDLANMNYKTHAQRTNETTSDENIRVILPKSKNVVKYSSSDNSFGGNSNAVTTRIKRKNSKNCPEATVNSVPKKLGTPLGSDRKRKLYSPKYDEKFDQIVSDNDSDTATIQKKRVPRKFFKVPRPTSSSDTYLEQEANTSKPRKRRQVKKKGKVEHSPRTKTHNSLFDTLKASENTNTVNEKANIELTDIAIYNYSSDSDNEFREKLLKSKSSAQNTSSTDIKSTRTRQKRSVKRINYAETSAGKSTEPYKPIKRNLSRIRKLKTLNNLSSNNETQNLSKFECHRELTNEKMRDAQQDESLNQSYENVKVETKQDDNVIEPYIPKRIDMESMPESPLKNNCSTDNNNYVPTKVSNRLKLKRVKAKGSKLSPNNKNAKTSKNIITETISQDDSAYHSKEPSGKPHNINKNKNIYEERSNRNVSSDSSGSKLPSLVIETVKKTSEEEILEKELLESIKNQIHNNVENCINIDNNTTHNLLEDEDYANISIPKDLENSRISQSIQIDDIVIQELSPPRTDKKRDKTIARPLKTSQKSDVSLKKLSKSLDKTQKTVEKSLELIQKRKKTITLSENYLDSNKILITAEIHKVKEIHDAKHKNASDEPEIVDLETDSEEEKSFKTTGNSPITANIDLNMPPPSISDLERTELARELETENLSESMREVYVLLNKNPEIGNDSNEKNSTKNNSRDKTPYTKENRILSVTLSPLRLVNTPNKKQMVDTFKSSYDNSKNNSGEFGKISSNNSSPKSLLFNLENTSIKKSTPRKHYENIVHKPITRHTEAKHGLTKNKPELSLHDMLLDFTGTLENNRVLSDFELPKEFLKIIPKKRQLIKDSVVDDNNKKVKNTSRNGDTSLIPCKTSKITDKTTETQLNSKSKRLENKTSTPKSYENDLLFTINSNVIETEPTHNYTFRSSTLLKHSETIHPKEYLDLSVSVSEDNKSKTAKKRTKKVQRIDTQNSDDEDNIIEKTQQQDDSPEISGENQSYSLRKRKKTIFLEVSDIEDEISYGQEIAHKGKARATESDEEKSIETQNSDREKNYSEKTCLVDEAQHYSKNEAKKDSFKEKNESCSQTSDQEENNNVLTKITHLEKQNSVVGNESPKANSTQKTDEENAAFSFDKIKTEIDKRLRLERESNTTKLISVAMSLEESGIEKSQSKIENKKVSCEMTRHPGSSDSIRSWLENIPVGKINEGEVKKRLKEIYYYILETLETRFIEIDEISKKRITHIFMELRKEMSKQEESTEQTTDTISEFQDEMNRAQALCREVDEKIEEYKSMKDVATERINKERALCSKLDEKIDQYRAMKDETIHRMNRRVSQFIASVNKQNTDRIQKIEEAKKKQKQEFIDLITSEHNYRQLTISLMKEDIRDILLRENVRLSK